MSSDPYDYENRHGIRPIAWTDFHAICKGLARAVAPFQPDVILAVGRGGYYPGTLIAHMLRKEIFPVRLSRRVQDQIVYDSPQWSVRPPEIVRGMRVLVVDEICSTGETLAIVRAETEALGAAAVRTAVMYSHSPHADIPDYIGVISDQLILNPWDREVLQGDDFIMHPEYADALWQQGITPDRSLMIDAPDFTPAKAADQASP